MDEEQKLAYEAGYAACAAVLAKDREEQIDAGKQMAQPPENPLNAQPSQQDADVEEEMRGWVPEEQVRGMLSEVSKVIRAYAVEGGEPDHKEYPADTCEELLARISRLAQPAQKERVTVKDCSVYGDGTLICEFHGTFGFDAEERAERYATDLRAELEGSKGE